MVVGGAPLWLRLAEAKLAEHLLDRVFEAPGTRRQGVSAKVRALTGPATWLLIVEL